MSSRKLFRYQQPENANRTLAVLRKAWPDTTFSVVREFQDWGWNILASKPDGSSGLVKRTPLSLIGSGREF